MMDWSQVEERIVEDDRNKWDRMAAAEELRIAPDGFLDGELRVSSCQNLPLEAHKVEPPTLAGAQRETHPEPKSP